MELVCRQIKDDGIYCEVKQEGVVYSVFKYTSDRIATITGVVFVMEKNKYDQIIRLHGVAPGNSLARITTSDGSYVFYQKQNGKSSRKSILRFVTDGGNGLAFNGIESDFRSANLYPIAINSKSKGLIRWSKYNNVGGYEVRPFSLPNYIKFENNQFKISIYAEMGAIFEVEPVVLQSGVIEGDSLASCLECMVREVTDLLSRWKEHCAGRADSLSKNREQFEFYRELQSLTLLNGEAKGIDPESVFTSLLSQFGDNEEKEPAAAAPVIEEEPVVEELVEQIAELKVEEGPAILVPVVPQPPVNVPVEVEYKGENLVVIDIGRPTPAVLDKVIFLHIHDVESIDDIKEIKVAPLRNNYIYIKKYTQVNGKSQWEYLHRYCMMNFVRTNVGAIIQQPREIPAGVTVDHANRVEYDNRMSNLRFLTQQHQNYNQNPKNKPSNGVLKKYFGIDVVIPTHFNIVPNDIRDTNKDARTSLRDAGAFKHDFNIDLYFEMKIKSLPRGRKRGTKVNLVNIAVEMFKARGTYRSKLEQLKEVYPTFFENIPLLTLDFTEEEKSYFDARVRTEIIQGIHICHQKVMRDDILRAELENRNIVSDTSIRYNEYLEICSQAGFQVERDETKANPLQFSEKCYELIRTLERAMEPAE